MNIDEILATAHFMTFLGVNIHDSVCLESCLTFFIYPISFFSLMGEGHCYKFPKLQTEALL